MVGTRGVRGRVDHQARRQIAHTLLRAGPLTARGLAEETKLSRAQLSHHLRALSRAGAVVPEGNDRIPGEEVTYALRLGELPLGAYMTLVGEFRPWVCLQIVDAIDKAETLSPTGVVERTGLPANDAVRYLLFMEALGLLITGGSPRRGNPLRRYVDKGKGRWWTYFKLGRDDDGHWRGDE